MNTILAILYFVLSLVGLDAGTSTFVERSSRDGATILESHARVRAGITRFECVRSASGHCHFTIFPRECIAARLPPAWPAFRCPGVAVERFALASGASHEVAGLTGFHLCVSSRDEALGPECAPTDSFGRKPPAAG
jgi:hypothetical protein